MKVRRIDLCRGPRDFAKEKCLDFLLLRVEKTLIQIKESEFSRPGPSTKKIVDCLEPTFANDNWIMNSLVKPQYSQFKTKTNFIIDWKNAERLDGCKKSHNLHLEICFDNRQAIGTNLLKMEIASRELDNGSASSVGVIIAAERDFLRKFGWDNAIGSSQEYIDSYNHGYGGVIETPIVVFSLFV